MSYEIIKNQAFEIVTIKKIQHLYEDATGYRTNFLSDKQGKDVRNLSDFCRLIQKSPKGKAMCDSQIGSACQQAQFLDKPSIFVCHTGLIEWIVPIKYREEQIGTINAGYVRIGVEESELNKQVDYIVAEYQLSRNEVFSALNEIPCITKKLIKPAVQLLTELVTYYRFEAISLSPETDKAAPADVKDVHHIPSDKEYLLSLNPNKVKFFDLLDELANDKSKDEIYFIQSIKLQNVILEQIRHGQRFKARESFNCFFNSVLFEEDVYMLKAGVIGLFEYLIFRASDAKLLPSYTRALETCADAVRRLEAVTDYNSARSWVNETFEKLFNLFLYECDGNTITGALCDQIIEYIKKNYTKKITLGNIARTMFITPQHASRIFKEHMGVTIHWYINELRMVNAFELLLNSNLPINRIAKHVGLDDSRMFNKVFKRRYGKNPSALRRLFKTT